jgi:HNH endonuclease
LIPVKRLALDHNLKNRLDARTSQLKRENASAERARQVWASARPERGGLREVLAIMTPGTQRCMYCGDNLATDIDHFEPISFSPFNTFEWLNHLLACSHCNSNEKRDKYPCDDAGNPLLLDPTRNHPSDHLRLSFSDGRYHGITAIGSESIEVYGLNRPDLRRGRERAFLLRRLVLVAIYELLMDGREDEAIENMVALVEEPFASVLQAIFDTAESDKAKDILGADLIAILRDPDMQHLIQLTWPSKIHVEETTTDSPS